MKRSAARALVIALGIVGLGFFAIPFVSSLQPNERAHDPSRAIDVSALRAGYFLTVDGRSVRYFIVRDNSGAVDTFAVPYKKGKGVLMPDVHWWRFGGRCQDFAPDHEGGRLLSGAQFRCRDTEFPTDFAKGWVWDTRGRNLGSNGYRFDDLPRAPVRYSGSYVLLPPNL